MLDANNCFILAAIFQLANDCYGEAPLGLSPSTANSIVTLLEQSGLAYKKVAEGAWKIKDTGDNIKEFYIRIITVGPLLGLVVPLTDRDKLTIDEAFLPKLLEINRGTGDSYPEIKNFITSNDNLFSSATRAFVHKLLRDMYLTCLPTW